MPCDTYPHDLDPDLRDPFRNLYHPPDTATEPSETAGRKRLTGSKRSANISRVNRDQG